MKRQNRGGQSRLRERGGNKAPAGRILVKRKGGLDEEKNQVLGSEDEGIPGNRPTGSLEKERKMAEDRGRRQTISGSIKGGKAQH